MDLNGKLQRETNLLITNCVLDGKPTLIIIKKVNLMLIFSYFLASFFSLISNSVNNSTNLRKGLLFLCFLTALFPLAFRGESVGIDTAAYYKIFETLKHNYNLLESGYEPGFTFLNNVVHYFGGTAPTFIFISALFSLIPFLYITHKYSESYILSFSILCGLGFYGFMFNGVRQAIAMAIITIAFHMLMRKKIIPTILLILFASLFHYTALIFLFVFFIIRAQYNFLFALFVWLFSILFMVPSVTKLFFEYVSVFLPAHYSWYVEMGVVESSFRVRFLANQFICILLLYVISVRRKNQINDIGLSLIYITFFGFILSNITSHLGYIERITYYFTMFAFISIPYSLKNIFTKNSLSILVFILYVVFSLFYIRGLYSGANGMIPYSTIWS